MTAPMPRSFFVYLLAGLFLLIISGCASQNKPVDAGSGVGPLPSPVANYEDIKVPPEMKLNTKKTLTINTESFHGGVLIFNGYVEVQSLKDYMVKSMKSDQWRHVGEASYNNVLLAFTKPNKTAIIVLQGGGLGKIGKTKMEMYVTVDAAAGKQLNPFGEPVNN
ncbi:MAG: hypothetical protein HKP52_09210 [Desulfofustis sp.]|nr:hypothetical protein [Desulfofustis sp.]